MAKVLIMEDDRMLNRGVSIALKKEGYETISAYSLLEGRQSIMNNKIDLLLLDINLPDGNGVEFCRDIRNTVKFPIVFFTANDTEEDMVKGFESGCDDYIAKPFSLELLKHKINVILRRNTNDNADVFEYKNMKINYDKMAVSLNDEVVNLTATEFKLLEVLSKNKGQVLTKEILLQKLWDDSGNFVDENTLSVNIRRLRKKIETDSKNPEYIKTVFGVGYTFGE